MGSNEGVLVTGGTGMIGRKLVALLRKKGYKTHVVSRHPSGDPDVFQWDVKKGEIDREALQGVHHIIHLAGAGLADKRWTAKRKQEIISSRVDSAKLLFDAVKRWNIELKTFISPSGINYYDDFGDKWITEDMPAGADFLSSVCVQWENASQQFEVVSARTVQLRLGIVLSADGGMLKELLRPLQFGLAPYFGKGDQIYSWVHIDDVCHAFAFALENTEVAGPYNVVAPQPVSNKNFVRELKKVSGRSSITIGVPAFALRLALGNMAGAVLNGARISSEKLRYQGFLPRFVDLRSALSDLLNR